MSTILVLVGAPAAGKGTQSDLLKDRYNFEHISTGAVLRKAVAEGTEYGVKAKAAMDSGVLVSDEIVMGVLNEEFNKPSSKSGYILDGIPRTYEQAVQLDSLVSRRGDDLYVVFFNLPDDIAKQRLLHRGKVAQENNDPDFREGDLDPVVTEKRIKEFHEKTHAVIEYYSVKPYFVEIDASPSIDAIFQKTTESLDVLMQSHANI